MPKGKVCLYIHILSDKMNVYKNTTNSIKFKGVKCRIFKTKIQLRLQKKRPKCEILKSQISKFYLFIYYHFVVKRQVQPRTMKRISSNELILYDIA